ncbi:MAG: NAD-dependent epimerase/dehydratase family protein [Phycisphaerae bacterium]
MAKSSVVRKLLLIGGSGFVSGTTARAALASGFEVWAITRGQKPVPDGVRVLVADRNDEEQFRRVIEQADTHWDAVIDHVAYVPANMEQDITLFRQRAKQLIFISTDFVFDPSRRTFPLQDPNNPHFATQGYGGDKRRCEELLLRGDTGQMKWTVVRPCHIYGPGSQLGCLPAHSRDPELIAKLRAGQPIRLVGGGYFLQQPIFARDLAELMLSAVGNAKAYGKLFLTYGPDAVESWQYFRIIADILGVGLTVEEIPVRPYIAEHPDSTPFFCHRICDLAPLKACGLKVPATSLTDGLRLHVQSLLG